MAPPKAIVLAGPNGAGKTTASRTFLADSLGVTTFVNPDVIAQGLAGFDPDSAAFEASRIMLAKLRAIADERIDFAFETTLAARSYASWLKALRESGYTVLLFYVWLESPDLAVARVARVAQRVETGGHNIPEATIRQRYHRSLNNFFKLYLEAVSFWRVYDNSFSHRPQLVAQGDETGQSIFLESVWLKMKEGCKQ